MKVQLKPGEAVKFDGRRVIGTEANPAFLVGDEAHLRPLIDQGLATEVAIKAPPPPPPPPPPPAPATGEGEGEAKGTETPPPAPGPTESKTTEAAPPASGKRKK